MTDWSEALVEIRNSLDRLKHLLNQKEWTEGRMLAEGVATAAEQILEYCKQREGP